jgi:GNAT superfamily N-acetyltransferase
MHDAGCRFPIINLPRTSVNRALVAAGGYANYMEDLQYLVNSPVTNRQLNDLFASSWEGHQWRDFEPVLRRSLGYICAWRADELIGFVNLAWDGGIHAFVLDTTVHPLVRRRGVGRGLVKLAVELCRERGVEWVHVDFDAHFREFYYECGFRGTEAGLLHLNRWDEDR